MPTTRLSPVVRVAGKVEYILYGAGDEKKQNKMNGTTRTLAETYDLGSAENTVAYGHEIRRRFSNRNLEAHELRVSWSPEELSPDNPEDVDKAMRYGLKLCRRVAPGCPVFVAAHGDGAGGCLHLHCVIMNNSLETDKAFSGDGRHHKIVSAKADELAREWGMNVVERSTPGSWIEKKAKLEADLEHYEMTDDGAKWSRGHREAYVQLTFGNIIDGVLNDDSVVDMESFEKVLGARGVGIKRKETTEKDGSVSVGFTYTSKFEIEGKTRSRRCKASKISSEFAANHIEETIAERIAERERIAEAKRIEKERRAEIERLEREAEQQRIEEQRRKRREKRELEQQKEKVELARVTVGSDAHAIINTGGFGTIGLCVSPKYMVDYKSTNLEFEESHLESIINSAVDFMNCDPKHVEHFAQYPEVPSLQAAVADFTLDYKDAAVGMLKQNTNLEGNGFVVGALNRVVNTAKSVWTRICAKVLSYICDDYNVVSDNPDGINGVVRNAVIEVDNDVRKDVKAYIDEKKTPEHSCDATSNIITEYVRLSLKNVGGVKQQQRQNQQQQQQRRQHQQSMHSRHHSGHGGLGS